MQKRGSSLFHIGAEIEKALKGRELAEGLLPHRARAMWNDVVGADVAAATVAETVRGGVLFVKVRSSVWANELTFYKADMLRKLNQKVGAQVLTDIHFTVASRGKKPKDSWPEAHTNRTTPSIPIAAKPIEVTDDDGAEPIFTARERVDRTRDRSKKIYAAKREMGWLDCAECGALFDPQQVNPGPPAASDSGRRALCPLCSTLAH